MIFYLGAPDLSWLSRTKVPLFVSRRRANLLTRERLPRARGPWALDSGGFKELEEHGRWTVTPEDYVREVRRAVSEIGKLQWAAVMDWMVEPPILYGGKTGPDTEAVGTFLSVHEHQMRTIESYCRLRELGGRELAGYWAPVLQGWCLEDYVEHLYLYVSAGIDLRDTPVVGVGSICRRQETDMAAALFSVLARFGLAGHLHAFGAKKQGLPRQATVGQAWDLDLADKVPGHELGVVEAAMAYVVGAPTTWIELEDMRVCKLLQSADSQAWSQHARRHRAAVERVRRAAFGPGVTQRGEDLLVGGRRVAKVQHRLAGTVAPTAPTQIMPACSRAFARGTMGKKHVSEVSCLDYALTWRDQVLRSLPVECREEAGQGPARVSAAPICAAAERVREKRAKILAYEDEVRLTGKIDRRHWASLVALPGAEGPLLPIGSTRQRMKRPVRRPMPDVSCRAWGTGATSRWGESRLGDPPSLESPWSPEVIRNPREKKQRKDRRAIERGLLEHAAVYWPEIERAAAKSLGYKARGFLQADPRDESKILGCGFWGCVFPTSDPRFVLKLTFDATEGPQTALAMRDFQTHPGIVYFHRLWRLPERFWTDEQGNAWIYVILRESVDVSSLWKQGVPARGYARIQAALDELPECCGCLTEARFEFARELCDEAEVEKAERALVKVLDRVGKTTAGKPSAAQYVASLIKDAYERYGVLLGDVHFQNVGRRVHDLSEWGVKRHKKLVVTDLGDLGQAIRTEGTYPAIRSL